MGIGDGLSICDFRKLFPQQKSVGEMVNGLTAELSDGIGIKIQIWGNTQESGYSSAPTAEGDRLSAKIMERCS